MSDLFEENDDDTTSEVAEEFDLEEDLEIDPEIENANPKDLDARRRLEQMLDEKRLRDELDDFGDY
ncbi:PA3496 family putative envelope integrity protein [Legionella lytica]|uniref:PA3496 family putative envelope integrity protein n=1 Tax=Legionella lytica TaxID=96232 RepID=A0ABW8D8F7_9GAMM